MSNGCNVGTHYSAYGSRPSLDDDPSTFAVVYRTRRRVPEKRKGEAQTEETDFKPLVSRNVKQAF